MRITESALRRIIRQEARRLSEAPGSLDRKFKRVSAYHPAQSVTDPEQRAMLKTLTVIAQMLGAPGPETLRVSEDPAVVAQVVREPGPARRLNMGYMKAYMGTLNGEPVVLAIEDDIFLKSVYKSVA